ncbi:MAG: hypothetical protein ACRDM1_08045 [Gaiellaceae bacterium]
MIAYSGPFWPVFLHVLGAMTLVGAMLTVALLSLTGSARPAAPVPARSAFWTLSAVAIPSWLVALLAGHWTLADESYYDRAGFITIGSIVLEPGVIVLLLTIGAAYWWMRSGAVVAGRIVAGLSCLYLALLALAWLAMSGKWS